MSLIVKSGAPAPYVHQEYPKWVTTRDGTRCIVNSEAEHAEKCGYAQEQKPSVAKRPYKNRGS